MTKSNPEIDFQEIFKELNLFIDEISIDESILKQQRKDVLPIIVKALAIYHRKVEASKTDMEPLHQSQPESHL